MAKRGEAGRYKSSCLKEISSTRKRLIYNVAGQFIDNGRTRLP